MLWSQTVGSLDKELEMPKHQEQEATEMAMVESEVSTALESEPLSKQLAKGTIPDQVIDKMSAAELRAVASARGYNLGTEVGSKRTRERFKAAQDRGY